MTALASSGPYAARLTVDTVQPRRPGVMLHMRTDRPPTKATVRRKSLDRPDGHHEFAHGVGDFVDLGSAGIGRGILEPGWRWSVDVKPAVGSESCQIHRLHLLLAGRLALQMDDGEIHEFEPNDVMDIPPGHDAWTVGDERVVLATMLMTDIVGSTDIAADAGDAAWAKIELAGDDVRGIAVHAAARVMAAAAPLQVLTSSLTHALAEGVACTFEDRGEHALKGYQSP